MLGYRKPTSDPEQTSEQNPNTNTKTKTKAKAETETNTNQTLTQSHHKAHRCLSLHTSNGRLGDGDAMR